MYFHSSALPPFTRFRHHCNAELHSRVNEAGDTLKSGNGESLHGGRRHMKASLSRCPDSHPELLFQSLFSRVRLISPFTTLMHCNNNHPARCRKAPIIHRVILAGSRLQSGTAIPFVRDQDNLLQTILPFRAANFTDAPGNPKNPTRFVLETCSGAVYFQGWNRKPPTRVQR